MIALLVANLLIGCGAPAPDGGRIGGGATRLPVLARRGLAASTSSPAASGAALSVAIIWCADVGAISSAAFGAASLPV